MAYSVLIVEDEFLIATEVEEVVRDLGYDSAGPANDLKSALCDSLLLRHFPYL